MRIWRLKFLLYIIMRSLSRKFLPYFSMCSWRLNFRPNFIIQSWRLKFLPNFSKWNCLLKFRPNFVIWSWRPKFLLSFSKWSWRHKLLPIAVFRCLKSVFHWLRSPSELVMCHEKDDRMFENFGRKHGSPWRGSVSFPLISVTTTELIYFFCNVKLNQTVQEVLWIIRTHRVFTVVTSW